MLLRLILEMSLVLNLKNKMRKTIMIKKQYKIKEEAIEFLSSIKIKTKKTPVEMKRESESLFAQEQD